MKDSGLVNYIKTMLDKYFFSYANYNHGNIDIQYGGIRLGTLKIVIADSDTSDKIVYCTDIFIQGDDNEWYISKIKTVDTPRGGLTYVYPGDMIKNIDDIYCWLYKKCILNIYDNSIVNFVGKDNIIYTI